MDAHFPACGMTGARLTERTGLDCTGRWKKKLLPPLLVPVRRSCLIVGLAALVVYDNGVLCSTGTGICAF